MTSRTVQKLAFALACGLGLIAAGAHAEMALNMPKGVTEISHGVYKLHMLILGVCTVIGIGVFGVMFWSMLHHRKSLGREASQFHHSTVAEIVWTIIPFFILIGMAVPAAGMLIKMEDLSGSDITIKVTGYQWKWQYTYIDEGIDFFSTLDAASNAARQTHASGWGAESLSDLRKINGGNYLLEVDNPLVVPVGKKVRLLLTSNDVIHAWWVPALGQKKDAIPGYVNEIWFKVDSDKPGTYRGQCAELCGRDHGFMPVVVKALPENEYKQWVDQQKSAGTQTASTVEPPKTEAVALGAAPPAAAPAPAPAPAPAAPAPAAAAAPAQAEPAKLSKDELMKKGQEVYTAQCAACHKPDGSGMPPTFPAMKGGKIVTGPVDGHIVQVLKGGKVMQPFGGALSDEQVAAVVTFERNSFGNTTGDVVQPAQVKALR